MTKSEFNEFMEQIKEYEFVTINGRMVVETNIAGDFREKINVIYPCCFLQGLHETIDRFNTEFDTVMVVNNMTFHCCAYIHDDELVFSEYNSDIAHIKLINIENFKVIENYSMVRQLQELSGDDIDFILNGEKVIGKTFNYNEYLDESFYAVESKDKKYYESRIIKTSDIKDINFILPEENEYDNYH